MDRVLLKILVVAINIFIGCAVPCPRDIKIGTLEFSAESLDYLPPTKEFTALEFVNDKGVKLIFKPDRSDVFSKTQLVTEILCERGGYLDKSVQYKYLDASAVHVYYSSENGDYTLAIDMIIDGHDGSKPIKDTALVETISIWGQQLSTSKVGSIAKVSSWRSNKDNPNLDPRFLSYNDCRMIKDTTIQGINFQELIVNQNNDEKMKIFYKKYRGIVAFSFDNGELWWRNF